MSVGGKCESCDFEYGYSLCLPDDVGQHQSLESKLQ